MNTGVVSIKYFLPSSIAKELDQFSKPRKRSQFIAEAIKLQIKQLQEEKSKKLLERRV